MSLLSTTLLSLIEERHSALHPFDYLLIEQNASKAIPDLPEMCVVSVLEYRDVAGENRKRIRYEPINSFSRTEGA